MRAGLTAEIEKKNEAAQAADATTRRRQRSLFFLGAAAAAVGFAMTLQTALNSNFVAQDMQLSGLQQGLLEACRESCGIFALLIMAMLAGLAEPLIGAAMLLLLAGGLGAYAFVGSFGGLVLGSFIWSQGLHVWMPLPNSMALALAEEGKSGLRLGQVAAAGAAGASGGLLVAIALTHLGVSIRPLWILAGLAGLLGAAACLAIPRDLKTQRERLVFRRAYGLYYLLCFLEGWRKQIFIAFAGFLLVKNYGTPLSTMLALWIISNAIGWMASSPVGQLIDRVGERRMLTVYYLSMAAIFVGYSTIHSRWILYALFVMDSVFFMCAMALTTYVNRLAPASERTATLSMGVAMNHVAAVAMPFIGGMLWKYMGYQWAFRVGAVAAVASVLAVLRIPARPRPAVQPA